MDHMPWYDIFLESFPEAIIMWSIGLTLIGYELKKNMKQIFLAALIFSIFSYFIRSLPIVYGIHSIIQIIIIILLTKIIFKLNFFNSTLALLTGVIILGLAESIFVSLFSNIFHIPVSIISTDPILRTFVPYIHFCFLTLLIFYLNKKDITLLPLLYNLKSKNFKTNKTFAMFLLILIILTIIIFMSLFITHRIPIDKNQIINLLIILLMIFVLVAILIVRKIIKVTETQAVIETQEIYLNNLNELYTGLRSQRHDFTNQIQVIHGLLGLKKYEAAMDFSNELCQHLTDLNKVVQVDNPVLAALLQAKMSLADNNKINFTIDVQTKIDKLKVTPLEFTRIAGNLLDNAFDATLQLPEEKRQVGFTLKALDNSCFIEIKNTGNPIPPKMLKKIFSGGITTKENHTGLGLTIVKRLIDSYKGDIKVTSDESETVFTVSLPCSLHD